MASETEQRHLELAKMVSLRTLIKNSNYTFAQQRVLVKTKFNNGQIRTGCKSYINKCFAISVADGMKKYYGYDTIVPTKDGMVPLSLAIVFLMGFQYETRILDTDNSQHRQMITKLLDICPYLQLQIFIGRFQDKQWYTTPNPSCVFGKGDYVIKMLNKGLHFELIENHHDLLPELLASIMIASDPVILEQQQIIQQFEQRKQTLYDSLIALNLATYEGMDENTARMLAIQQKEEQRIERQKKADEDKAKQLALHEAERAAQISSDSILARLLVDQN